MKTTSNLNSGHTKTVSTPYQRRIKSVPKDRSRGESDHPTTVREYGLYLKRGIATSDIAAEIVRCLIPFLKPTGTVEPEEWIKQCPCFDVANEL